ncbi:UNVERIFIED_CONTAM: hypothetical protein Slati_0022400 [Sesamum latifolium]|uniref:RNase H type-1 domain-containing protein n=1 Tax=Sesamum latifolium TaxID=2727402 RepID=A0AAW2Y6P4_9LAMI
MPLLHFSSCGGQNQYLTKISHGQTQSIWVISEVGNRVENGSARGFRRKTLDTPYRRVIYYTRKWSGHSNHLPSRGGHGIAIKFDFKASNNEVEYEALVLGMRMAQIAGALHLLAYSDSQLIVNQVIGEYETKEESMMKYLPQIEELKTKFKSFQL